MDEEIKKIKEKSKEQLDEFYKQVEKELLQKLFGDNISKLNELSIEAYNKALSELNKKLETYKKEQLDEFNKQIELIKKEIENKEKELRSTIASKESVFNFAKEKIDEITAKNIESLSKRGAEVLKSQIAELERVKNELMIELSNLIRDNFIKLQEEFDKLTGRVNAEIQKLEKKERELRNIKPDAKWAYCRQQPKNSKVNFSFDYEKTECTISVAWQVGSKDRHCTFTTTEESHFAIVKQASAMELLKDRENEANVFDFYVQDKSSIQIAVGDAEQVAGKKWISSFFYSGNFVFEGIQLDGAKGAGNIEDVRLYISQDDEKTTSILLKEYLLKKAEFSYLGYEETGRLVTAFQDLFTSPDGKMTACPPIMQETKEIYNELVERAYSVSEKNPLAYLHLQAYIDLAPADTIKPYIEKEKTVNLTNQELSFNNLVEKVFGSERTVKSLCLLSKYTATNGRNARAVKLFAESFAVQFGIQPALITTKEEVRPNANKNFAESDRKWYEQMKKSVHVVEKSVDDIKKIHDRYYKVVRTDGRTEWWVLTGELDSLRFENDNPRIREDVTVSETGKVKEMTFAQIRQSGIPENVVKLMEAL